MGDELLLIGYVVTYQVLSAKSAERLLFSTAPENNAGFLTIYAANYMLETSDFISLE